MNLFKTKTFKYNEITLEFEPIKNNQLTRNILFVVVCFLGLTTLMSLTKSDTIPSQPNVEYETAINLITNVELNSKNLKAEIAKYNFKYPQIIYAQAVLESNHFKSNICKENNNLFGMREAKQRTTTAVGTENNHASYNTWQDSVIDRALFETSFLRTIQTKEQYFAYLSRNYAEAGNYVEKLKQIINQQK